jgi:ABC-type branched-subunit amino acid transport system ATPase component
VTGVAAPLLEVNGLTSGYGGSTVIRDVSLSIGRGEALALIGKNGMGKTSLLKTIMGFLPVESGTVTFQGEDVTRLPPHAKRRRALAYAPQEQALFQDLTVRENLRLGLLSDEAFEARLAQAAEAFPILTKRLGQRAGTLSGGEQKMLIVARGLMAEPLLFMLDEVTEGLQPSVIDRLAQVLVDRRRRDGIALLIVEQHLPFALEIADRYAVLKRGEIIATGPVTADAAPGIETHMQI